jgi:lipopolysaccharide biosynthesis glycosyltransferase
MSFFANGNINPGLREMIKDETIVVVCSADDNYVMPLAVTIRSALEHLASNRKIVFFIIDGGIREHNKRKILKSLKLGQCEVEWLAKPDQRRLGADIRVSGHVTIAAYYRLFMPELLPEQYKKVIYLDCDLVVKEDLGQLWDIEMGEYCLLGVQDFRSPWVSSPLGLMNYQELGISPDCQYLNTGVLVINLQGWRNNNITDTAIKYLQQNRKNQRYHDQDVINALFAGKWGELDPRWNHQAILSPGEKEILWKDGGFPENVYNCMYRNPYIIHYAYKKPWSTLEKCPRNDEFFHYLDMTAWSGWRFTFWHWNWMRLVGKIKRLRSKFYLKSQGVRSTIFYSS